MKRVIFILTLIVFSVYIIPYAIVLSLSEKDEADAPTPVSASESIRVLNSKTDSVSNYDLEEYLVGVIAAEMPASYETEALKAQAVAARSYILSRTNTQNPDHKNADVCTDSTHCKAYLSEEEANEKWGDDWSEKYLDKIKTAVSSTEGEYISYNGEVAVACFSAFSSGKTENAADVWGGEVPYLQSVDSPGDLTHKDFTAQTAVPVSEAYEKLDISSLSIGEITHTEGGSVKTINIGGKEFSGTQVRSLFGLNSANFEISVDDKTVIFTTKGKGHGVGMSQYGANEMAKSGQSYTEILLHYYSNVTIEKM